MQQKQAPDTKADRNKIYFLVAIIIGLLGLNGFLYFKSQKEAGVVVSVDTEKDRLRVELQKIESELDKINSNNLVLGSRLKEDQQLAREKIAQLKVDLDKGKITQGDLNAASEQVRQLKEFVRNYNEQVSKLEKQNRYLKSERDSLKSMAHLYNAKTNVLRIENKNLNRKVKIGAALKASNILVEALRVKDNGKSYATSKASSANKFRVNFAIVKNDLAPKTYHKVFLRVFDPAGNLIADDFNMFKANGQQMQYSNMIEFSYNNDNTAYEIDWVNPKEFIEGTYTLILYADGYEMGRSSIELD